MASALLDLYNGTSTPKVNSPRVDASNKIPNLSVKFFDTSNAWQHGFENNIKNLSALVVGGFISNGLPTLFTDAAMTDFNKQLSVYTIPPQGFVPAAVGFTGLQRWTPTRSEEHT